MTFTLLFLHPEAAWLQLQFWLESLVCSPQQKVSEAVPGRDINQKIRVGRVPGGIRACPRSPDSPEQDPTLRSLATALGPCNHTAVSPLEGEVTGNSSFSQHRACSVRLAESIFCQAAYSRFLHTQAPSSFLFSRGVSLHIFPLIA